MKTCSKCKEIKDESCFGKLVKSKDGYASSCKECRSRQRRKRYRQNHEQELAWSADWKQTNRKKVRRYNTNRRENLRFLVTDNI